MLPSMPTPALGGTGWDTPNKVLREEGKCREYGTDTSTEGGGISTGNAET